MTTSVFLAGSGTPGHVQDHQRDMYRPAVQGLDGFAETDTIDEADLVIGCPDVEQPAELADLLQQCTDRSVPVLIDKPTLLSADVLTELATRFPATVAGHPWRFHPALTTARGRVAAGGLGLLHAIHGELLLGPGDGPHPLGELRNLAVHALDVV
jgi:predicted dehydrogenase